MADNYSEYQSSIALSMNPSYAGGPIGRGHNNREEI